MPNHAMLAIRALQETCEDLSSLQGDVQLLVDVATGKADHVYDGSCPDAIEGFDVRNPYCPVCCAIARLEGAPLTQPKEAACA